MTNKSKKTEPVSNRTLSVIRKNDESDEETIARVSLQSSVQAASTIQVFGKGSFASELDLDGLVKTLDEQTKTINAGYLGHCEAMLIAQAHTLDAIFNTLARRAARNMNEYIDAADRYMRLALKAQSQCRTTLETLATIKNPPIMGYVKQANIAHGPQQVNNGIPSPARENKPEQNKLLEEKDGERLDFGAKSATIGTNPAMATVGEIDGAKNIRR